MTNRAVPSDQSQQAIVSANLFPLLAPLLHNFYVISVHRFLVLRWLLPLYVRFQQVEKIRGLGKF